MRIGSLIIFHLSEQWKAKFSILCDVIFWWGCRRNLKLITLGSERVNIYPSLPSEEIQKLLHNFETAQQLQVVGPRSVCFPCFMSGVTARASPECWHRCPWKVLEQNVDQLFIHISGWPKLSSESPCTKPELHGHSEWPSESSHSTWPARGN